MVADVMESWVNEADIDGFNIAYVSNPESYEDLVELLVPVLQERGLMWEDYTVPGGTYRENLLGTPGQSGVPDGHPAANFKYETLREKYGDEKGDIFIDRRAKGGEMNGVEATADGVKEGVNGIFEKKRKHADENGAVVSDKRPKVAATETNGVVEVATTKVFNGVSITVEVKVAAA